MKQLIYFMAFLIACTFAAVASGSDDARPRATADAYFDIATGHKYIKNQDNTYAEYSRRGKVLRTRVPATMPLLVSGRYIREISPEHYLVYTKNMDRTVLPALTDHPYGWKCEQMVSRIPGADPMEAEAYEPAE